MRMKLNLGGVWGLVSLEFSHPSRQSSWRADRLGPSTGVRSRLFPVTAPFPGSSPASPVPSSPDWNLTCRPAVLCILLWMLRSARRGRGHSDAPRCLTQSIPTLQVPHPGPRGRSCPFPVRGHFRQGGSDTSSSPLAAPTTFSVFSNLLVTRI